MALALGSLTTRRSHRIGGNPQLQPLLVEPSLDSFDETSNRRIIPPEVEPAYQGLEL